MSETKKRKPKKQISGPLAEGCKAFAVFTKQQPYYKLSKQKGKKVKP